MAQPASKQQWAGDSSSMHPVCIVHVKGLNYGDLQLFSEVKDDGKRFTKIQQIKERRLAQSPGNAYMMKDICSFIPDILAEQHGFHWDCYKRFTMNLARLTSAAVIQKHLMKICVVQVILVQVTTSSSNLTVFSVVQKSQKGQMCRQLDFARHETV